jgi:hypothetical protein
MFGPRVSVSVQSRLKMSQCRSPGSTIWQWDCPRRSSQNAKASAIVLGILKTRALVVIRTTALSTSGDNPNRASPDTRATSHGRRVFNDSRITPSRRPM